LPRLAAPGPVVKYASGISTAERLALFDSAGVTRTVGSVAGVGAKVVSVSADPAVVAERLNRSARVAYAEPNFILTATASPNDPLFPELYGMNNTGQTGGSAGADIDAPEGWDAAGLGGFPATGGVKIGIVDTGIDQTHPERRRSPAASTPSCPERRWRRRTCLA
jgi:hypothetical protein